MQELITDWMTLIQANCSGKERWPFQKTRSKILGRVLLGTTVSTKLDLVETVKVEFYNSASQRAIRAMRVTVRATRVMRAMRATRATEHLQK